MGRYEKYENRKFVANKTKAPHPIWQGIGCLMFIIVPIISYALADVTIQAGVKAHWSLLPYQLVGTPLFPDFVWKFWQLAALYYHFKRIGIIGLRDHLSLYWPAALWPAGYSPAKDQN
jgi:hypothetical protein